MASFAVKFQAWRKLQHALSFLTDAQLDATLLGAAETAVRRTAYAARRDLRGSLDKHFYVRNKPFLDKGLRVKNKRRPKSLKEVQSEVGTIDRFLAEHEASQDTEATRPPLHAKRRWIPLKARTPKSRIMSRQTWPANELKKRVKLRAFANTFETKYGTAVPFVGRRRGPNKYPIEILWAGSAKTYQSIPSDWPALEYIEKQAEAGLLERLANEIDKAAVKNGWR